MEENSRKDHTEKNVKREVVFAAEKQRKYKELANRNHKTGASEGGNMEYLRSKHYDTAFYTDKIMGPNPIKLEEELMRENHTPAGAEVMDLGSGQGVTSIFLAKEYGFRVTAADLWSDPEENRQFFAQAGLTQAQIVPVKADATALPFPQEQFDAVVSIDSYNYFGRDPAYLDEKLLPCVKRGGYVYLAIPGMKRDCHDNLPKELLLSWTPEQLDYMHDVAYWSELVGQSRDAEVCSLHEMESNDEVWADWLRQENEYAVGDRKAMEAGAGAYLNFIAIVLRKK